MARGRKSPSVIRSSVAGARTDSSVPPQSPAVKLRDVVNGIKLDVSGRELTVRLTERIRWHRERADTLLAQMRKLREIERESGVDLVNILGKYDSPRVEIEKKLREHQERAGFLAFLRDHVAADQLYRLDSMDLRMTEILPEKPW